MNAITPSTGAPEPPLQRRPLDRRLPLLISAYVALVVLNNIGSITFPTLITRNPALVVALSARIRHLLFSIPAGIRWWEYVTLPTVRLGAAAAVSFAIGRLYGTRGMGWLERQLGDQRPATLRWIEQGMDRAGWLMVVAFPGSNVVAALAGYRAMPSRRFAALITVGIVVRLAAVWLAAKQFADQLSTLLDWITRYQWPLVGAFAALTIAQSFRQAARSPRPPGEPPSEGA